jgi:hypothetical protein
VKIVILLHSLLKKIQEWMAVIEPLAQIVSQIGGAARICTVAILTI